ncbi:hypothetical protein IZ6_13290 [Terrihabitans soli]|uniref:Uncharacterized protein n=1 Tax=Terrihabitans soli TaxID=708113 RepID=A0A6S6QJV7_9HYPH|nr:hypothetical protein [Terrihabitans soli]BCJ90594.1 hypothetical protein IZ6_13290 [Terrihabitans soli]
MIRLLTAATLAGAMFAASAASSQTGAPLPLATSAPQEAAKQPSAAAFNGKWSVLIVTENGTCDRGYRYTLIIDNGNVTYGGKNNFNVSGQVEGNGAVTVSVTQGNQGALGVGRLSGKYGRGTWEAPAGGCSGRWEAEKRG